MLCWSKGNLCLHLIEHVVFTQTQDEAFPTSRWIQVPNHSRQLLWLRQNCTLWGENRDGGGMEAQGRLLWLQFYLWCWRWSCCHDHYCCLAGARTTVCSIPWLKLELLHALVAEGARRGRQLGVRNQGVQWQGGQAQGATDWGGGGGGGGRRLPDPWLMLSPS